MYIVKYTAYRTFVGAGNSGKSTTSTNGSAAYAQSSGISIRETFFSHPMDLRSPLEPPQSPSIGLQTRFVNADTIPTSC